TLNPPPESSNDPPSFCGRAFELRSCHGGRIPITLAKLNRIEKIIRDILSYSRLVATEKIFVKGLRDIKDAKIIACALAGKTGYIVTGDKDLLVLKEYKGVQIVTPRAFLDIIK
ncbi:MAG: putative toxin-antitoxin system toxin component, PIN family, partial [Candidatus Omnitrophota bacterium]